MTHERWPFQAAPSSSAIIYSGTRVRRALLIWRNDRLSQRERDPRSREATGDREVIVRYLDGDSSTFGTVDAWIRTEIRASFPVLRDEGDDLTQAAHVKLVKALREERFRSHSSLKTYVVRLARYTCVDRIRARHRAPLFSLADESSALDGSVSSDTPYRRLFHAERHALLRQIVMLASARCRDLWWLAYVEQLSYDEIARRLSLPAGTIKSRMWACRQRALGLLDQFGSLARRSERGRGR